MPARRSSSVEPTTASTRRREAIHYLTTAEWVEWTPIVERRGRRSRRGVCDACRPEQTLFLAVRSREDGNIRLRARRGGEWGSGRCSERRPRAPRPRPRSRRRALYSLAVFVRGGDGLIYWLSCRDAPEDCDDQRCASPSAWTALPPPPSGIFVGKPSAVWLAQQTGLTVAAIRDDRVAMYITGINSGGTAWRARRPPQCRSRSRRSGSRRRDRDDPQTPGELAFFARNRRRLLVNDTLATDVLSYRRRARFAPRRGCHLPWPCPDGRRRDHRRPRASRRLVAIQRRRTTRPPATTTRARAPSAARVNATACSG